MEANRKTFYPSDLSNILFIQSIDQSVVLLHLRNYFSGFGAVNNIWVANCQASESSWSAFVEFAEASSCTLVMAISHHRLNDKMVRVSRVDSDLEQLLSESYQQHRVERSLILKNLPLRVEKPEILDSMKPFGPVDQISKLRRSSPNAMFCYITMQNAEDALSLQEKGYFMFRGRRRIHVGKFVPRHVRLSSLELPSMCQTSPNPSSQLLRSQFGTQVPNRPTIHTIRCNHVHGNVHDLALSQNRDGDQVKPNQTRDSEMIGQTSLFIRVRPGLQLTVKPSNLRSHQSPAFSESTAFILCHKFANHSLDGVLDPNRNLRFNLQSPYLGGPSDTPLSQK